MVEVNGMAHVILTVSQFEKSRAFYSDLLPFLGMTLVFDGADFCYHVGGRTAIGIQRCDEEYADERFVQGRVGLHHLCLRARSREHVDLAGAKAAESSVPRSCAARKTAYGRPVITTSYSRIPMASASRSTSSPAKACWRQGSALNHRKTTRSSKPESKCTYSGLPSARRRAVSAWSTVYRSVVSSSVRATLYAARALSGESQPRFTVAATRSGSRLSGSP